MSLGHILSKLFWKIFCMKKNLLVFLTILKKFIKIDDSYIHKGIC